MATTCFFEEKVSDLEEDVSLDLELGRSSFYGGISRIYINVDGKSVILDEETGKRLYDAMMRLGGYLGYDRD